jgi:hypothetical protein
MAQFQIFAILRLNLPLKRVLIVMNITYPASVACPINMVFPMLTGQSAKTALIG